MRRKCCLGQYSPIWDNKGHILEIYMCFKRTIHGVVTCLEIWDDTVQNQTISDVFLEISN